MKVKEKKCKGTGIAAGYGCGTIQLNRRYGLGVNCCFANWLYNSEEGKKKLEKATLKATEPRRSLEETEKNLTTKSKINAALKNTKVQVHAYIRKRDQFKPCISCGCQWNEQFEAGHCFSTNNYRSIRFKLFNINGQCFECNNLKDGNEAAYLLNLPGRIGQKNFNELIHLAKLDKHHNKHWTIEELKEIRKEVKQLTKQL